MAQCYNCKKEFPQLRTHFQKVSWFRGDDEAYKLCNECWPKREQLYPDMVPKTQGKTYPAEKVALIKSMVKFGHKVRELTPYQFRINGVLDLFPVNDKYHNIKTGERGRIPYKVLYNF